MALELWRTAAYREERYTAIALTDLKSYAAYRTFAAVPMFEEMIVTGAWWDYVDAVATHQLGDVLRAELAAGRGARMRSLLLRWARGPNLWKRRAAILCQLRFKSDTDLQLLYSCLEPSLLPERSERSERSERPERSERSEPDIRHDFFIRKSIGWALRQYAWTDAAEIRRYVSAHRSRLSPLSVKEATRNIGPQRRPRK